MTLVVALRGLPYAGGCGFGFAHGCRGSAARRRYSRTKAAEKCGALSSCLWEVDSLRSHCCPTVASIASLFNSPMTAATTKVDLEPLGALTYAALGQLETRKRLRTAPVAMRPPLGLLAAPPDHAATLGAGLGAWRP